MTSTNGNGALEYMNVGLPPHIKAEVDDMTESNSEIGRKAIVEMIQRRFDDPNEAELIKKRAEKRLVEERIEDLEAELDDARDRRDRLEDEIAKLQPDWDDRLIELNEEWDLEQREPGDPILQAKADKVNMRPDEALSRINEITANGNESFIYND